MFNPFSIYKLCSLCMSWRKWLILLERKSFNNLSYVWEDVDNADGDSWVMNCQSPISACACDAYRELAWRTLLNAHYWILRKPPGQLMLKGKCTLKSDARAQVSFMFIHSFLQRKLQHSSRPGGVYQQVSLSKLPLPPVQREAEGWRVETERCGLRCTLLWQLLFSAVPISCRRRDKTW